MEYKKLGKTDLEISRIGFGCWAIGGHGYGEVDDKESILAIRKALDSGINFFDTADVYGFGHSEEILSKALGAQRNNVIIATKFGINWNENGRTFKDCSAKRVSKALENSLRRLKIDTIPIYQIHWPDPNTTLRETMGALIDCQKSGKVKYIGISNFDAGLIEQIQDIGRIESLQSSYNLLDRSAEKGILQCCHKFGMAFIAHSPLARGFLSGKYKTGHTFSELDTRNKGPYFSRKDSKEKKQLLDMIKQIGGHYGKTVSQVALRWLLNNPMVACVIVGLKNIHQVRENAASTDWTLSLEDFEKLSIQSQIFANADS
jgi:aryl-alcohol dehydrogenase-like predicted oxidoreductase